MSLSDKAHAVVDELWQLAGLPRDAVDRLTLNGEAPLLPTSFHVGVAAQSTIASAALAASELGRRRGGPIQAISVDMHDAERECTGYFSVDGKVPRAWAPLSGLYPCADGHVRIHANFTHHRDGVLAILGIHDDPETVERDRVGAALAGWEALEFERAAAESGLVVAAVRSFEAWDRHPQSAAVDRRPVVSIEKIGDAAPRSLSPVAREDPPLTGIRALDLTRILAGPICGRTLAAYGADVMLVNAPHLPNIDSIAETSRGKLSAHLDLRDAGDAARLRELARESHLFIQGYRPGAMDALGFGPAAVADTSPGIVYVSLSAYGDDGPWADRRGFDSLVQSATGFNVAEAQASGSNDPKPMPVQILDCASGFLMAFAAMTALMRQQDEGGSWHVRISLARTAHWLRELGRLDDNFADRKLELANHLLHYESGFGDLRALPHAARFSETPAKWRRPSMPPGSHPPRWSE